MKCNGSLFLHIWYKSEKEMGKFVRMLVCVRERERERDRKLQRSA
jgi:hypothetical protein